MNRELIILFVLIILAAAGFFVAERALAPTPEDAGIEPDVGSGTGERPGDVSDDADTFKRELEDAVIAEIGQPIEGFVPSMFLEIYPELQPADFDGVDALIGMYVYEDGELRHELNEAQPIHSAAEAVSPEGYATLYAHVRARLEMSEDATPQEVLEALEGGGETDNEEQTDMNTVVCTEEMKQTDVCTQEYAPVCGLVEVQCVTEPCEPVSETFSNGCTACSRSNVISYTPGVCVP